MSPDLALTVSGSNVLSLVAVILMVSALATQARAAVVKAVLKEGILAIMGISVAKRETRELEVLYL
mgnify:CR=1 FL=1